MGSIKAICLISVLALSLLSCANSHFNLNQLAKSDIDMVSDIVWSETNDLLKQLLIKLYKRNSRELAKAPLSSIDSRVAMIFQQTGRLQFAELHGAEEVAAMNLAFDPGFSGDRVFALIVGLTGMIRQSYNYDASFFIHKDLDAQRLYNSARNIEVMAWKLIDRQHEDGRPYIISHSLNGVIDNTSFERLFGKMIHTQDLMAKIIADRDSRTINTVIKGTLSVFLPL